MDEQKKDQCGGSKKASIWGSTFGGVIGVVQIGEKESNVVGMDVSHGIGKRSSCVGIVKDGQIFCTYSFCYIYCPGRRRRS